VRVIIIGAGELGHLVAAKLCAVKHDVVVVDIQSEGLDRVKDSLDAMFLEGKGTSVKILKEAGAENADVLLALSGDEASNVLASRIASKLGTKQTICRVYSRDIFSEKDGITPEYLGIGVGFSSIEESIELISGILYNRILLEKINFSNPSARINVVKVPLNSEISGVQIKDLPCTELLGKIRIAAVVRNRDLLIPHGTTVLNPGDRVYVAGKVDDADDFVKWLSKDATHPISRVIIAGATRAGELLSEKMAGKGYDIRIIERNRDKAERLLNKLPPDAMVIDGDPTNADVLTEAGVAGCDVFVALSEQDENNILSCLLASRLGAQKLIALTSKPEYIDILPSLEQIGCWFNSTQIAANTVFRLMAGETVRVDAELGSMDARLEEILVTKDKFRLANKRLAECQLPPSLIISLVLRGDDVIPPTGDTVLQKGDVLVTIAGTEAINKLRKLL